MIISQIRGKNFDEKCHEKKARKVFKHADEVRQVSFLNLCESGLNQFRAF